MRFRLLGAFEMSCEDQPVALGRRRERLLLALLLMEAGKVVSVDRLIDLLWEGDEPARALSSLHSHVARLRAVLQTVPDKPSILRRGTGYVLDVPEDSVDIHRFRSLIRSADQSADPAQRSRLLREALALWQGPPLADLAGDQLRERIGQDLRELRLGAIERWLAAELELGHHHERLPDLAAATAEFPLRERLIGLRMLALHRCGQSGEASSAFSRYRQMLIEEMGLEPGQELQELQASILRGDPALALPMPSKPIHPFQLPPAVTVFAGRERYLRHLDEVATPAIAVITGLGGAGKTTLAVHWARRASERFPDGQLYLNLRGFHPTDSPMTPEEAFRRLLAAFNVPANLLPSDVDAQAALYRSLSAGRKMLILLDNARDSAQIRPLLPGGGGCLVLVTSRNDLASLIATEGATPIPLEMLTLAEASQLLALRLGSTRVDAEPEAVAGIAGGCAGLPLALGIVAARAALRPSLPLSALLGDLRGSRGPLDQLNAGDPVSDVRSVFSWSYRALDPSTARLFRLLSLHPGPSLTCDAASEAVDVSLAQTRAVLASLTQAYLITETSFERYEWHDLVRSYAMELASATDPSAARESVIRNVVAHYVRVGLVAAVLLDPDREPIIGMSMECPELSDQKEASAWFAAEQSVLLRVIELSYREGFSAQTWQLAWCLTNYLQRHGQWGDWVKVLELGLEAAERLGDVEARAFMYRFMGNAMLRTGRLDAAELYLERSVELSRALHNHSAEALGHRGLAIRALGLQQTQLALTHNEEALRLFRLAGNRPHEASTLNGIAWAYHLLGDPQQAVRRGMEALTLARETGSAHTQAVTLDTVGVAYRDLGDHERALAYLGESLVLHEQTGDRYYTALTLDNLGDVWNASGDHAQAVSFWERAAVILEELHHHDLASVRKKLDDSASAQRAMEETQAGRHQ